MSGNIGIAEKAQETRPGMSQKHMTKVGHWDSITEIILSDL